MSFFDFFTRRNLKRSNTMTAPAPAPTNKLYTAVPMSAYAIRIFSERLLPHNDDVDGVQPFDIREKKVLDTAIELNIVPDYSSQSWYSLYIALLDPAPPADFDPKFWISFRTWALYTKALRQGEEMKGFDIDIHAPSGMKWPEGTKFLANGETSV